MGLYVKHVIYPFGLIAGLFFAREKLFQARETRYQVGSKIAESRRITVRRTYITLRLINPGLTSEKMKISFVLFQYVKEIPVCRIRITPLPRASPLAFHWLLITLAFRRWFLARRDRSGVTADMSNDTVPYKFLDQCLMHPPWEVAFGKFGKSPRKGGFTRYFVDQYPTAQVPHLAVDLKTFD